MHWYVAIHVLFHVADTKSCKCQAGGVTLEILQRCVHYVGGSPMLLGSVER